MDNSDFIIPSVTVLTGHVDEDTAYVVNDYPYGGLTCTMRYWIETRKTGSSAGDQRMMRQSNNPRRAGHPWNKPHKSTYSSIMVLYLDEQLHVHGRGIPLWITGSEDTRNRHMGLYDALDETQRKRYDANLLVSKRVNPRTWQEWAEKVSALADHIEKTGENPELVNQVWTIGTRRYYLSDPAAYVTAAFDRLTARQALADPEHSDDGDQ